MKSYLQPLRDRVLVEPLEEEQQELVGTKLIVPENITRGLRRGKILAVGDGMLTSAGTYVPIPVEVGDIVIYRHDHTTRMVVDGKIYYIVGQEDVIVKIIEQE